MGVSTLKEQEDINKLAMLSKQTNIVKRQQFTDPYMLYDDYIANKTIKPIRSIKIPDPINCYGCNEIITKVHSVYMYSCKKCGDKFNTHRYLSRDLTGKLALVTGCRTKLGHMVVRKLLDAGATVIGLTRRPECAYELFSKYKDYETIKNRLIIYKVDLDVPNLEQVFGELLNKVKDKYECLDILINCAAQTIRCRERNTHDLSERNRYNDDKYVKSENVNSWNQTLHDLDQVEMEELYRINAVAPTLLVKTFYEMLHKSSRAFIVNVHAREGLFSVYKSNKHMHTNMAKAGMAMSTLMLYSHRFKSSNGKKFSINGCDPGWISIDEYYENDAPWIYPPLDEIDGASRILYPIFKNINGSPKTRKHYDILMV